MASMYGRPYGDSMYGHPYQATTPPLHRFGGRKRFDPRPGIIPPAVRRMRAINRRERGGTPAPWLDDAPFAFPSFAPYRKRPYDQEVDD